MKKVLGMMAAVMLLGGCSALDVEWELHATYKTDELKQKQKEATAVKKEIDRD